MNPQLRPIESEIDKMINRRYGIEANEEIVTDDLEVKVVELTEDLKDEDD